jgi:hypothetical protein
MLLFDHIFVSILFGLICIKFFKPEKSTNVEILGLFILGASLPDIIDKPLYYIYGYGRSLMHSIVIVTIIFILSIYLLRSVYVLRLNRKYEIAAIIFYLMAPVHYLMDSMWQTPKILFYPLLGVPPEWGTFGFTPTSYIMMIASFFTVWHEIVITVVCCCILVYVYVLDKHFT